jgi:signal recognition particle receptor subunit beta
LGSIRCVIATLATMPSIKSLGISELETVLSAPQILGVPLLLLANKQDSPLSLSVEEIRHDYEDWHQRKLESARRNVRQGEPENDIMERIASLDVMGASALEGYAPLYSLSSDIHLHQNRCQSSSRLALYTCTEQ